MLIRSAHSLRYIGGLSVNLNHLKRKLDQEEREDVIDEAVGQFKAILDQSGFSEAASLIKEHFQKNGNDKQDDRNSGKTEILTSVSDVTIYRNAVIDQTGQAASNEGNNRDSSSSEGTD